jgi:protein-L-isoaspartate(D-aspartate) O-methyltransferase
MRRASTARRHVSRAYEHVCVRFARDPLALEIFRRLRATRVFMEKPPAFPRRDSGFFWRASVTLTLASACQSDHAARPPAEPVAKQLAAPSADAAGAERASMVAAQVVARGVRDARVIAAMREVPRHAFVPAEMVPFAYEDRPLPIGYEQTISQPYIVAVMSELAELGSADKALEIGTGSGYQAAVLARLCREVYTIEILEPLARRARQTLAQLGMQNVHVRAGDGYQGWPEQAPFDAIVVTAAPPEIPEPLKQQLGLGGRLVIPVGTALQELRVLTRTERGFEERRVLPVRFVPMTGEAQRGK